MTKNTTPSNIKLGDLKKQAEEINKMEIYELDDEGQIEFYPIFPESKISDLEKDLIALSSQAYGDGIEFENDDMENIILLLIAKHFTHLGEEFPEVDYGKYIQILEHLVDVGIMRVLLEEVFMKSEVTKVFTHVGKLQGRGLYTETMTEAAEDELARLYFQNKQMTDELLAKQEENKKLLDDLKAEQE